MDKPPAGTRLLAKKSTVSVKTVLRENEDGQRIGRQRMTITIFGITGRAGLPLARAAWARGLAVRGMTRGSELPTELRDVQLVRGTFADTDRVAEAVAGVDAVCCVIGPRPPSREAFCAAATAAIVGAMRQAGCRRLLCLTGAMIGEAPGSRSLPMEWMARSFARRVPELARDREEQERIVRESGLDWTIVKPPRLTDGPATGRVRAGADVRVGLFSRMSRADLAAFMLDEIERRALVHQRVLVRGYSGVLLSA
jgi:putative NADH-flavin reductase